MNLHSSPIKSFNIVLTDAIESFRLDLEDEIIFNRLDSSKVYTDSLVRKKIILTISHCVLGMMYRESKACTNENHYFEAEVALLEALFLLGVNEYRVKWLHRHGHIGRLLHKVTPIINYPPNLTGYEMWSIGYVGQNILQVVNNGDFRILAYDYLPSIGVNYDYLKRRISLGNHNRIDGIYIPDNV